MNTDSQVIKACPEPDIAKSDLEYFDNNQESLKFVDLQRSPLHHSLLQTLCPLLSAQGMN